MIKGLSIYLFTNTQNTPNPKGEEEKDGDNINDDRCCDDGLPSVS